MKKLILIFFGIFIFFFSGVAFAQQTPDDIAKKYQVSFPIAQLGNCADYSSCRTYCEDPLNQKQCIEFAKKKGFYKEESIKTADQTFWQKTKQALGCDNEASCRELCSQQANFDKCNGFAKENNLSGGQTQDPTKQEILNKAKDVLGCSSYSSCMEFCQKSENKEKCSNFAKQEGLRGGEQHVGPGGCNSEETCRTFCSVPSNYQICSGFATSQGGNFSGPGGCNSEQSCRTYCEQNPKECGYIETKIIQNSNLSEMCGRTPGCSWSNNTCTCNKPSETGIPKPSSYPSSDPKEACLKYPGCSFVNNACNCANANPSNYPSPYSRGSYYSISPYPTYSPSNTNPSSGPTPYVYKPSDECTKVSGCSWNGSSCQCQQSPGTSSPGSYYDPAKECSKTPNCTWADNRCQCPPPSVKGASTRKSLLEILIELLFNPNFSQQ